MIEHIVAQIDIPVAGPRHAAVEPADPERYVWLDDLDRSDPAVTDDALYGHDESWLAFLDALGADGESTGVDAEVVAAGVCPGAGSMLAGVAPGGELASRCDAVAARIDQLTDGERLDLVEAAERMSRWADGLRIRVIAAYADRHPAGTSAAPPGGSVASPVTRWLPDELGMTLHVSRLEAQSLIASAQRLAHVLPDTLDALQADRIDARRADTISYATRTLPTEKARTVEAAVLTKADGATHRQVYDRTRRAVHRVDPDGEYRRHQVARTERRVTMQPREEGMASLWAFGPAVECEATFTMLTRLAHSLGPDDSRTLDQRRFDLLSQVVQGRITVTDLADLDALLAAVRSSSDVDGVGVGVGAGAGGVATTADGRAAAALGAEGMQTAVTNSGDAGVAGARDAAVGDGDAVAGRAGTGCSDAGPTDTGPTDTGPTGTGCSGTGCSDTGHPDAGHPVTGHTGVGGTGPTCVDDAGAGGAGLGESVRVPLADEMLVAIAAAALARQPRVADTVRKPLIQVVVGLDTLLGSDRPGEMVGHGPIPAVTARALAAGGSLARMVTDPLTGHLRDYGRTTYAPPAALADLVRARDQVCRGPVCSRPVRELDHRQRWDRDGPTSEINLDGYCRSCHVLKELDGWHVLSRADGRLTWVSPAGRLHDTEPYDYRPFTDDVPAEGDGLSGSTLDDEVAADQDATPPF